MIRLPDPVSPENIGFFSELRKRFFRGRDPRRGCGHGPPAGRIRIALAPGRGIVKNCKNFIMKGHFYRTGATFKPDSVLYSAKAA
jgi:hypothetical protein